MFGADVTFSSLHESLQEIFTKSPTKLDSSSAKLVMAEQYLLHFGLTTEAALDVRPLGIVAMYDAEDPLLGSLWEERLEEFCELELNQLTGLSFIDYLDLSRHQIIAMNAVAIRIKKKRQATQDGGLSDLEKQLRAAGISLKGNP